MPKRSRPNDPVVPLPPSVAELPGASAGRSPSALPHGPARSKAIHGALLEVWGCDGGSTRVEQDPALLALAQRFSFDSTSVVGYPVVALGDAVRGEHDVEVAEDTGEMAQRVRFPEIGWELVRPQMPEDTQLPSSAVLDVYLALLWHFAQAGFPEDGVVRFSRYELLSFLGWLSKGGTRDATYRPSGRHYKQLKSAIRYLKWTTFVNRGPGEQVHLLDGTKMRGEQGFSILEHYALDEDDGPTSHGPIDQHEYAAPKRSSVMFSRPFLRQLARGAKAVPVDLELFFAMPAGAPRHLIRLFSWMWSQGITALRLREVFQRLGSVQATAVPARARQILSKAHEELVSRGVLAGEPTFERRDGEWFIQYVFADPQEALSLEQLLMARATAYGIVPAVARELSLANRAGLMLALAAASTERIVPRQSLASMLVFFARRGPAAVVEAVGAHTQRAAARGIQMELDRFSQGASYPARCARARTERLLRRPDIDPVALRARWAQEVAGKGWDAHDWVLDGLTAIHLDHLLAVPGIAEMVLVGSGDGAEEVSFLPIGTILQARMDSNLREPSVAAAAVPFGHQAPGSTSVRLAEISGSCGLPCDDPMVLLSHV